MKQKHLNNKSFFWNPASDDTAASAFCRPKPGTITLKRNGENLVISGNGVGGIVGGGAGLAIG